MAWDTENTKQKIKNAALTEFTAHGPDGTTVERIAKRAKVNKERIYNYFGNKQELFKDILREELEQIAKTVGLTSFATEDIGDYAGRMYDYHRENPDLMRLLRWESLTIDGEVPNEHYRRNHYAFKAEAVRAGQETGTVTDDIDATYLVLFILAIVGWWSAMPQISRMLCGEPTEEEHAKRRAAVVAAARRLGCPHHTRDER